MVHASQPVTSIIHDSDINRRTEMIDDPSLVVVYNHQAIDGCTNATIEDMGGESYCEEMDNDYYAICNSRQTTSLASFIRKFGSWKPAEPDNLDASFSDKNDPFNSSTLPANFAEASKAIQSMSSMNPFSLLFFMVLMITLWTRISINQVSVISQSIQKDLKTAQDGFAIPKVPSMAKVLRSIGVTSKNPVLPM